MRDKIIKRLSEIEKEYDIQIVYAVESGSRAWGFASVTSDYDVRFIYVNKPEWYLGLFEQRDVIEIMEDEGMLDFAGWDIKKALRLFRAHNPPLMEWLNSPIVYVEKTEFAESLRVLMNDIFVPKTSIHHYLHMSERNFKEYLDKDTVRIKKYMYVLRPIFACMWILKFNTQPPTEYEKLYSEARLSDAVRKEIDRIYQLRIGSNEKDMMPKSLLVDEFIQTKLTELSKIAEKNGKGETVDGKLQNLFIKTLKSLHND